MAEIEKQHTCPGDAPPGAGTDCEACKEIFSAAFSAGYAEQKAKQERISLALELLEAVEVIAERGDTLTLEVLDEGWEYVITTSDGYGFDSDGPDLPSALIAAARSVKGGG